MRQRRDVNHFTPALRARRVHRQNWIGHDMAHLNRSTPSTNLMTKHPWQNLINIWSNILFVGGDEPTDLAVGPVRMQPLNRAL